MPPRRANAKRVLHDLRLLSRPLMWLIPLVPFVLGYLMAHRQAGVHRGFCSPSNSDCISTILSLVASILVWGPLISLAVLAINDVYDVAGDSLNPRRADAPVSHGRLSLHTTSIVAHTAGIVAIAVASSVRPAFGFVTFVFLVLGWLYSVPPVRLKVRPGFDVAINALGDGGLSVLGGWTSVRAIHGFPWIIFAVASSAAAALYLPTTIADYDSDRAAGYTTIAIRLGPGVAYQIGLGLWILSGVGCFVLAAGRIVLPQRAVSVLLISIPALIGLYRWAFGRVQEQRELLRGMGIVGGAAFLSLLIIVLMYVGVV